MMFDYDAVVVGSGPAGSSFARLAADRLRLAVIDKQGLAGVRPKPCGGLLSPDAQRFLARSGLTLPKEILVTPQIFAVKTIDLSLDSPRYYQRSYLNMDRARFDGWLRSLIPDSVQRIQARCTGIKRRDGGFELSFTNNGRADSITAKYLIGADGAGSIVRRTFFKEQGIRTYVAIQRWYRHDRIEPFYSCVFDRSSSDCCSWSISKDGYMLYGGAFGPKGCRENFERQLESAGKRWFRFLEQCREEACLVYRPARLSEIVSGRDGVILLGEAGGFISPSSLEGISWAMRSSELASRAFSQADPVAGYRRLAVGLKFELGLKLAKSVFMYTPFLRRIIMESKIGSLKNINTNDERI